MIRHVMKFSSPAALESRLAEPVAAPSNHGVVQSELDKLQGHWRLVYWLFDGHENSTAEKYILSFVGKHFTITEAGTLIERGTFENLNPEQDPKTIDYAPTEVNGNPFSSVFPAIYLVEDDVFIACVGYAGARPGHFSAEDASHNELVIYKRVGK